MIYLLSETKSTDDVFIDPFFWCHLSFWKLETMRLKYQDHIEEDGILIYFLNVKLEV